MKVEHRPVLAEEVLTLLAPASGSLQIDATLGGGGHTERILGATDPDGRLLGLDADGAAIARVRERLAARFGDRLVLRQANFRELGSVAPSAGFGAVDGLLFDLGLSSFQLADDGAWLRDPGRWAARHALRPERGRARLRAPRDPRRARAGRPVQAVRRGAPGRPDRAGHRRGPQDRPGLDRRGARRARRAGRARATRPAPDPSCDPGLPGAPHRRQRRARCTRDGPRRRRSTSSAPAAGSSS